MKAHIALIAALSLAAPAVLHAADAPAFVTAAVTDKARPEADVARDAARKPADMLAFSKVKPGESVADLLPGGGYFTRLFAKAVGPKGHVYAVVPPAGAGRPDDGPAKIAADPAYGNVSLLNFTIAEVSAMAPVDVLWTAQNYHDFHLTRLHLDVPGLNKLLFSKVKPGGYFIVVDHRANAGAPVTETADTLHRIDPAVVRKELEAAGFVFDGEIKVLDNPADDHTKLVFDPSVRGHTDQFVYRFKRPA
jgi:predicted methyltransferase